MTDERMALIELIEKGADADLIRDMLAFAAERRMNLEVEALTGALARVRSPERPNHRNGFRERAWDTRAGRIALSILRLGKGFYFPAFLEPRRTAEKALTAVIQPVEMFASDIEAVRGHWALASSKRRRGSGSVTAARAWMGSANTVNKRLLASRFLQGTGMIAGQARRGYFPWHSSM